MVASLPCSIVARPQRTGGRVHPFWGSLRASLTRHHGNDAIPTPARLDVPSLEGGRRSVRAGGVEHPVADRWEGRLGSVEEEAQANGQRAWGASPAVSTDEGIRHPSMREDIHQKAVAIVADRAHFDFRVARLAAIVLA